MRKTYIHPESDTICLEMVNGILTGSKIHISKDPVNHFDNNKKTNNSTIWNQ